MYIYTVDFPSYKVQTSIFRGLSLAMFDSWRAKYVLTKHIWYRRNMAQWFKVQGGAP